MAKLDYVVVKQSTYEAYPGEVIHVKFLACHNYAGSAEGYVYVEAFGHWFRKEMDFYPGWCMKADIPVRVPERVAPGVYRAKVCMYAYQRDCKEIRIKVLQASVKLQVNAPKSVTVGEDIVITGKVQACVGSTCKPVPNIRVWVSIPGSAMPVYTNAKGEFTYRHRFPAWSGKSIPVTVSVTYQGKNYVKHLSIPIKSKEYKGGVQVLYHIVRVGKPVIKGFDYKGGRLYIYFDTNRAKSMNVYWRIIRPVNKYFGKELPSSFSFPVGPNKVIEIELVTGSTPYNYVWQEIVRVKTPSVSTTKSTTQQVPTAPKKESGQVKVEVVHSRMIAPPRTEALVRVTNTYPSGKRVTVRVVGLSTHPTYERPVEFTVFVPAHSTKLVRVIGYGSPRRIEYRLLGEVEVLVR